MTSNMRFLVLFGAVLLALNTNSLVNTFAQEASEPPPKVDTETNEAVEEPAQPEDKTPETTDPKKPRTQRVETLQKILERLESLSRDPFAPSDQISREHLKKTNQFVPVTESATLPEIELISYAESSRGESDSELLAGLRIIDKIYFVRIEDQITIRHSGKNLVIQIQKISNGRVEVKVGELSETIIVW